MDQRFAYAATDYAAQIINLIAEQPGMSRDVLMRLGELVYGATYSATDSDIEAIHRIEMIATYAQGQAGELLRTVLRHGATAQMVLGAARWADQAFPQVILGHKLAASMGITNPSTIASIRPPWKAFLVEIPNDLYFAADDTMPGGIATVTRVLVRYHEQPGHSGNLPDIAQSGSGAREMTWSLNIFTNGKVTFWRVQNTEGLLADDASFVEREDQLVLDMSDMDQRTIMAMSRLVLNVCLKLADPNAKKPLGKAKSKPNTRPKGSRIEPTVRVFDVVQPVVLDIREHVKQYILHGKSHKSVSPQVQVLVRGHWKPILSARVGYPVWVEPAWRGKADAPIRVTPKIIKNPGSGSCGSGSDPYRYW